MNRGFSNLVTVQVARPNGPAADLGFVLVEGPELEAQSAEDRCGRLSGERAVGAYAATP